MFTWRMAFGLVFLYVCISVPLCFTVIFLVCCNVLCNTECASHGLSVSEMDASVVTLRRLAEKLNAECVELRRRQEHHGYIADLLIRERADERDFIEVRSAGHDRIFTGVKFSGKRITL